MPSLAELIASYRQSRIRRAAIRDLQRLSPRQLADIGVSPDSFAEIVDGMLAGSGNCAKEQSGASRTDIRPRPAFPDAAQWRSG